MPDKAKDSNRAQESSSDTRAALPGAAQSAPANPAKAEVVSRRRWPSAIWLLPVVAVLVGLSLVIHNWMDTGPTITIRFNSAEGLAVGKTQIQYKEVVIGMVEGIELGPKGEYVLVKARLDKSAAYLANDESRFWVVRPRLGLDGVTGLGTLLSGAYIGVDAGKGSDRPRREFTGLDMPPAITSDREGKRFVIYADSLGSLDIGSPIYYRKIQVGRLASYKLDENGQRVALEVFIDAPNDRFVTQDTRFWNASGVNLSLNAEGLKLNTQSLATLIAGGLAFDRVPGTGSPDMAQPDSTFELYSDQGAAFEADGGPAYPVRMEFDQSVRGLATGASIEFQGIYLGNVRRVYLRYDAEKRRFISVVDGEVQPERLHLDLDRIAVAEERQSAKGRATGQKAPEDQEELKDENRLELQRLGLVKRMINYGLRGQLKTANVLTGQMYVSLEFVPKAPKVDISKIEVDGVLILPTVKGDFDQLQGRISNIIASLEQVPFGDIGKDVRKALQSVDELTRDLNTQLTPEARKTLQDAQRTLQSADSTMKGLANATDGQAPLVQNASQTLEEINRAARSLRVLSDYLQTHPETLLRGRNDAGVSQSPAVRLPDLTPTPAQIPAQPSGSSPAGSSVAPNLAP